MLVPLVGLLCLLSPLALQSESDFAKQVERATGVLDQLAAQKNERLLEGDLAGATRTLVDVVPEDRRTAAKAFALGQALFALDFKQSYRFHEEAFVKEPREPLVIEAWAIEQHRLGRFAEAEALYLELLDLDPEPEARSRLHALRADCLLRLGQLSEACAEWRSLNAIEHDRAIDEAVWRVWAPPSPEARRCALLQRALAAENAADSYEELLLLDLHWDRDLWNADVNIPYTAHDLALAQQALGAESPRAQTLAFLAHWTTPGRRLDFDSQLPKLHPPADNSEAIREEAKALRFIGGLPKPPESSRLTGPVFQILIDNDVASTEDLLAAHEVELLARAKSSAGDLDALHVLLYLYEQTWDDELAELQRIGWRKFGDLDSAVGLLTAQRRDLRDNDLTLLQALAAHPGEERLCKLQLEAIERAGDSLVEPLSRLIMAQLAHMEDCQTVSHLFRKLEDALRDRM